jgi:hypothetical protein
MELKDYITIAVIHRHGIRIEPGTRLQLSDAEVKYQRHALLEITDEVPEEHRAEFEALEVQGLAEEAGAVEASEPEPAPEPVKPHRSRKKVHEAKAIEAADGDDQH